MNEIRLNLITRKWVIMAKEKGKKPEDFILHRVKKRLPEFLESCPFCPGNESKTPDEVFRVHAEEGWRIRVVRHKFSKLSEEGERNRWDTGVKKGVNGIGIHELIVETPMHNMTTANMSVEQLRDVIQTYKDRLTEIYRDPRVEYVIIFKNSGPSAGTSIEHPLSQIVGIPITPLQIRERFEAFMKFFDETGDCMMCKTIQDELHDGARVLFNTEHFVSFVPYAALSAFHIWIFPKRHSGCFADILPEEILDLSVNLKSVMAKLCHALDCPDFNYGIRSGKLSNANSEFIHWYMSIVPRVDMVTGFELGTGMHVNSLVPEVSAEFLRNTKVPEYCT
jgi:UDPglucose--hexose-1-phosphate uridylyltransferase